CDRKKGNIENNSPPCWLLSVFAQPPPFANLWAASARGRLRFQFPPYHDEPAVAFQVGLRGSGLPGRLLADWALRPDSRRTFTHSDFTAAGPKSVLWYRPRFPRK